MIIPGVSIATMSSIVGIYEKLIFLAHDCFSTKIPTKPELKFLFLLGTGGLLGIILITAHAPLVANLSPGILFSFLLGMSISSVLVSPNTTKQKFYIFVVSILCIAFLYPIKTIFTEMMGKSPIVLENYSSIRLIGGSALAMSFSLLPGLSGSLVLVLLGILGLLHQSVLNITSGKVTLSDAQLWIGFFLGIFLGGIITSKLLVYFYKKQISWIHYLTSGFTITAMFWLFFIQSSMDQWGQECIFFSLGCISLYLVRYTLRLLEYFK